MSSVREKNKMDARSDGHIRFPRIWSPKLSNWILVIIYFWYWNKARCL